MSSQAARRADGEQAAGDSFHMKTNTLKAPARELWVPDEDVYDAEAWAGRRLWRCIRETWQQRGRGSMPRSSLIGPPRASPTAS